MAAGRRVAIALVAAALLAGAGSAAAGSGDGSAPSRGKVVLLSALVPGLGQFAAGDPGMGKAFVLGEISSWMSFVVFRVQGNLRKDRYIEFAERFAGVEDAGGETNAYYGYLARYDRSGEPGGPSSYNEIEVRARARDLYPADQEAQEQYIHNHAIVGSRAWDWDSEGRRFEYADLRIASETAFHRSEYAVGGMVAGRILSLMHAIWLTADRDETGDAGAEALGAPRLEPFAAADLLEGASRFGLRYRF